MDDATYFVTDIECTGLWPGTNLMISLACGHRFACCVIAVTPSFSIMHVCLPELVFIDGGERLRGRADSAVRDSQDLADWYLLDVSSTERTDPRSHVPLG